MYFNFNDSDYVDYSKIDWNNYGAENKTDKEMVKINNGNYEEETKFEDDIMDADFEFTSVENDDIQNEQNTDIFYPHNKSI